MNRRIIAGLILAALMLTSCFAASETEAAAVSETNATESLCENNEGTVVNAVIALLKEQGWLDEKHAAGVFDEAVTRAVCAFQEANDLEITGTLNDDALTFLIWGLHPEELSERLPESCTDLVWLPTNDGEKFHVRQGCSDMIKPFCTSVRNAIALGIRPCIKCSEVYIGVQNPAFLDDAA